jgi:hypothetical protein
LRVRFRIARLGKLRLAAVRELGAMSPEAPHRFAELLVSLGAKLSELVGAGASKPFEAGLSPLPQILEIGQAGL